MKSCTFFGHKDCDWNVEKSLTAEVEKLINEGVKNYYIGYNGSFDRIALHAVNELKKIYNEINVYVVLSYLEDGKKFEQTIFPEGIENVPKRFAIDYRNKWMVENSEYVISYIRRTYGGAYKFVSLAKRKGKVIIEL